MIRSMMQVYVKGSKEAVELYQKAFEAKLISEYKNDDGSYYHSELDVYGQILSVAEARTAGSFADEERISGNTMQFCLHFRETETGLVKKAFAVLESGSRVLFPLGPCEYSGCMVDFIDRFGVRWCLFA